MRKIDYYKDILVESKKANIKYYEIRANQCLSIYKKYCNTIPSNIVEIGCGGGEVVSVFRNKYKINAIGIDNSYFAIENAISNFGNYFYKLDILECQISDTELYQKFDFAICFELFQFFILEDFYKALENVGLFLKPGGIFLLMVPNCGNPYLFPYLAYSDPYNKMKFTPESLYRILKVNGSFKVLKIIRWNSANSYFKIFIRNLFQKLFSLICHRLMSIFFQVGGNINKNIFTDNIYMSSHIAAILRKEETES